MGLGQPDMQGKCTCFGPKTKEQKQTCHIKSSLFSSFCRCFYCGRKFGDFQGFQTGCQQEKTHKHNHAADNGYSQIGFGSPEGFLFFVEGHPYIGGQRHDLKEDKGGHKIGG